MKLTGNTVDKWNKETHQESRRVTTTDKRKRVDEETTVKKEKGRLYGENSMRSQRKQLDQSVLNLLLFEN